MIVDILSIIATVFLGCAALYLASKSNKLIEKQNSIAIIDKSFEVYNYFINKLSFGYFQIDDTNKQNQTRKELFNIEFLIDFLYCDATILLFNPLIEKVKSLIDNPIHFRDLEEKREILTKEVDDIKKDVKFILKEYKLKL